MANQRSPDQTVITVALSEELKGIIDAVSGDMPGGRSHFIREAVKQKLQDMGKRVADTIAKAPSRLRRPTRIVNHGSLVLNESDHETTINAETVVRKNVSYKKKSKKHRKAKP